MRRLGKQRVEVMQILKAMNGGGWADHPATKMWDGHGGALAEYGIAICDEWISRGYRDTCRGKIMSLSADHGMLSHTDPDWLHDKDFHAAHRSNLLRKDPVHYGQFGWTETDDLDYVWPV